MIELHDAVAGVMLLSLMVYAILAGADFGGGVWDLVATGPRKERQRMLIGQAIAPVWEANHVWLILIVVLAFTCFPTAFSVASIAMHVPLTVMLFGIVLRGSAFVFRHYGEDPAQRRRWGTVFAVASIVTPIFLGISLGAITAGGIRVTAGIVRSGFFAPWIGIFPLATGMFALALFSMLAAVYLTNETDDPALQDDFRLRAIAAAMAVGVFALISALTAGPGTLHFQKALLGSQWSLPHQIATGIAAAGVFAMLILRRYRVARVLAITQTILIIAGWGLAQRPFLIAPDLTIAATAASRIALQLSLLILGGGSILLIPSIYWLFRVFKR